MTDQERERKMNQLRKIYYLKQLQEVIPYSMSFEDYFALMEGLYRGKRG